MPHSRPVEREGAGTLAETLFWRRHASPASVLGLGVTYPALVLALYRRSPRLLGLVLVSVVGSLRLPAPPDTDTSWATQVVLGEQVWLERGLRSDPAALGLTGVDAVVQLLTSGRPCVDSPSAPHSGRWPHWA
ncbi:DUF6653 family protein [Haloglomus litoreum]|uniref:DUF6653 family protein n=1 Tax=Haloglomus litoreum TaxID=3034026 RepID=UPI0023E8398B|nr:DUF6653 family protein [Haloglomus sp. DT116]